MVARPRTALNSGKYKSTLLESCFTFSEAKKVFYTIFPPSVTMDTQFEKEKAGKGQQKPQGRVYFWLTHMLFRGVQPRPDPKGALLMNLK